MSDICGITHTQQLICFKRYTLRSVQLAGKERRTGAKVRIVIEAKSGATVECGNEGHENLFFKFIYRTDSSRTEC